MIKFITVLVSVFMLTGCTSIQSPDGWRYTSIGEKNIKSMKTSVTEDGSATVELKGYSNEAAEVAGQVAEGVARGVRGGGN